MRGLPSSAAVAAPSNKTIKDYLRTSYLADFADGYRLIGEFIVYYNTERLHSAIGYVAPAAKLARREQAIFQEREAKLQAARAARQAQRQANTACPVH